MCRTTRLTGLLRKSDAEKLKRFLFGPVKEADSGHACSRSVTKQACVFPICNAGAPVLLNLPAVPVRRGTFITYIMMRFVNPELWHTGCIVILAIASGEMIFGLMQSRIQNQGRKK